MENKDISNVSIEELLQMVNDALKNGISVNKFSINNNWKGSSVKTKLRRGGYSYNKDLKSYVKVEDFKTKNETKNNTVINTKRDTKNDTKTSVKNVIKDDTKNDTKHTIKEDARIKDLEQQLQYLNERINRLEKHVDLNKKNRNKKGKYYIANTRDTTTKGIRLYTEVKEELDRYLDEHKDKKVIEIFSYAILDYINKYK